MISTSLLRTRWAAIGAAVAVTLGAGGLAVVDAAVTTGERTVFVAITPCRLVDTRPTSTVGPKSSPVGPGEVHTVTAHGTTGDCTIPTDAVALSLNVTAIGATAPTFLAIWPAGATQPDASSLNPSPGQPPTPNAVTTDLSTDGRFSIFNLQGSVDVLVDVNGYYADHNHDDRYYTKPQVDAAIATGPWSIPLAPAAATYDGVNAIFNVQGGGSSGTTGLYLLEAGFGRFHHGFVLPPQYVAGTDLRLDMTWAAETSNATGCTFRFEANQFTVYRGGSTVLRPSAAWETPAPGFGGSFPSTLLVAPTSLGAGNGFNLVVQDTFLTVDGAQLQPGDHVMIALNRRAGAEATDTCTDDMIVLGLAVGPA
jgi:hypothetical protein